MGCGNSHALPQKEINKCTVVKGVQAFLVHKDQSALQKYWADNIKQHNPMVGDGSAALKDLGSHITSFETKRVLGDGDYVVTHSLCKGFGPTPMIIFDIFRLENGKFAEHWDIMQAEETNTVSGRSQIDGPNIVIDQELTEQNKRLIQDFMDQVVLGHKHDLMPQFINTTTYFQHNPHVGDGLAGFGKAMQEMKAKGQKMEFTKVHKIIADGNFVFTFSEGEYAGKHVAFADLFRIDSGKIVEHWDCIQPIPEKFAHANGMF